jgi:UDP-glucuronate decarboxylase
MRLLVTGGTGFFGRALLRHWARYTSNGCHAPTVTILSRNPEAFLNRFPEFAGLAWLHFHQGDVLQPSTLPTQSYFTHVLHAATDSTFGAQLTPLDRYTQIADGTRHVLNYAVASGVRRFLLTSSGGVYGEQPAGMARIAETYNGMPNPLDEQSAYGVAKRCAEHLCTLHGKQYGLEVVIARCFAFVGRDLPLDAHFAIGNFIQDALCAPEIIVRGDGSPVRSYLDQRDLAHWLETMLLQGQAGRAYNVGSERAITVQSLAQLVRDLLAPGKRIKVIGSLHMQTGRNRYIPSTDRAREELGLQERYPLEDAIMETAKAFMNGN